MKTFKFESSLKNSIIISTFILFLTIACDKGSNADQTKIDVITKNQNQIPVDSIDVCALLSKSEVEQTVGKPVSEPESDQMANLFTCSYGDPEYPGVATIVGLSVFIASNSANAKKVLETARTNAASVQEVSNLGEGAFWDKILKTLWFTKGKYEIGIEVDSDAGGLDTAKKLALKVLERLP